MTTTTTEKGVDVLDQSLRSTQILFGFVYLVVFLGCILYQHFVLGILFLVSFLDYLCMSNTIGKNTMSEVRFDYDSHYIDFLITSSIVLFLFLSSLKSVTPGFIALILSLNVLRMLCSLIASRTGPTNSSSFYTLVSMDLALLGVLFLLLFTCLPHSQMNRWVFLGFYFFFTLNFILSYCYKILFLDSHVYFMILSWTDLIFRGFILWLFFRSTESK